MNRRVRVILPIFMKIWISRMFRRVCVMCCLSFPITRTQFPYLRILSWTLLILHLLRRRRLQSRANHHRHKACGAWPLLKHRRNMLALLHPWVAFLKRLPTGMDARLLLSPIRTRYYRHIHIYRATKYPSFRSLQPGQRGHGDQKDRKARPIPPSIYSAPLCLRREAFSAGFTKTILMTTHETRMLC